MGQQTQHRQHDGGDAQGGHRQRRTPALDGMGGGCRLLPEQRHIHLGQIRSGQTAGEEEQPLHRRDGEAAALGDVLHDGLVHQRLADVAAQPGNTG